MGGSKPKACYPSGVAHHNLLASLDDKPLEVPRHPLIPTHHNHKTSLGEHRSDAPAGVYHVFAGRAVLISGWLNKTDSSVRHPTAKARVCRKGWPAKTVKSTKIKLSRAVNSDGCSRVLCGSSMIPTAKSKIGTGCGSRMGVVAYEFTHVRQSALRKFQHEHSSILPEFVILFSITRFLGAMK